MTEHREQLQRAIVQKEAVSHLFDEKSVRRKALKRFNRLYLFLPLGITAVLAILVMAAVIAVTVFNNDTAAQQTGSGLADLLVIAVILFPLTLLMTAIAGLCVYALYKRRERGSMVRGRIEKTSEKIGGYADTANEKAVTAQANIADKVIKINSKSVRAKSIVRNITQAAKDAVSGS